jgi:glycosidase
VLSYWLDQGADGWRLDVADELPDVFLERLRQAVKKNNPQAFVVGEVWEDATNKFSYGNRRPYLLGKQLDLVMNYPFADGILYFIRYGNAVAFMDGVMTITDHYPAPSLHTLMNHLGTHDTKRLITALVGEEEHGRDRSWQAKQTLTDEQLAKGEKLVQLATLLQYTLPGVPCVYYGDEMGMSGYRDPFNRAPMAWENPPCPNLSDWYRCLGELRASLPVLKEGELYPYLAQGDVVSYIRSDGNERLLVAVNRGQEERFLPLPDGMKNIKPLLGEVKDGTLILPPLSGGLLQYESESI